MSFSFYGAVVTCTSMPHFECGSFYACNSTSNDRPDNSISSYLDFFLEDVRTGSRLTYKGKPYTEGSFIALKQTCRIFREYELYSRKRICFDDIDYSFFKSFVSYLYSLGYAHNTVAKNVKYLKILLSNAFLDGYAHKNVCLDKRFKVPCIESDSIYLTRTEIDRMRDVDLSSLSPLHSVVRDVFMIGVWTAQRFSDYSRIDSSDILRCRVGDRNVTAIQVIQKKTGARVVIPCSNHLLEILERYDYVIPRVSNQTLNEYIKVIARKAGIDGDVAVTDTKGGKHVVRLVPRWKLVHSHTARRTGATLMYLSGMDIYDIMKITGHSSPVMLKKYIKADSLDVLDKIVSKYSYFD